jgi:hypothetical protein
MKRKDAASASHKDPLANRYGEIKMRAVAAAAQYHGKLKKNNASADESRESSGAEKSRTKEAGARRGEK